MGYIIRWQIFVEHLLCSRYNVGTGVEGREGTVTVLEMPAVLRVIQMSRQATLIQGNGAHWRNA